MNSLLIGGGVIALLALLAKKKGQGNEDTGTQALFWAHKTGAGFVCVGWAGQVMESTTSPDQLQLNDVTVIHPAFINPTFGEPTSPGYLKASRVYLGEKQRQPIANGAGVYQILQPLIAAGILESDTIMEMIFEGANFNEIRDTYKFGSGKSIAIGRTWPFKDSQLFRIRSTATVFTSYLFPVLLEIANTK